MTSPFDTMQNPHKEVKQIVGVLRNQTKLGRPLGFRVKTDKGIGDIDISVLTIEISGNEYNRNLFSKILHDGGVPSIILFERDGQLVSQMELDAGQFAPDFSDKEDIVRSMQYHIYLLERNYKHKNSTETFEVSYEFYQNGKLKRLSGYLQAPNLEHAIGTGKSYIAQTQGVGFFDIACPYAEPFYGEVKWGPQSPLLAIRLTLEPKWNKVITPKITRK